MEDKVGDRMMTEAIFDRQRIKEMLFDLTAKHTDGRMVAQSDALICIMNDLEDIKATLATLDKRTYDSYSDAFEACDKCGTHKIRGSQSHNCGQSR